MCLCCIPLVKAIDAFLAKADDSLEEELKAEGYALPAETVATVNEVEALVTTALESNADELLTELDGALDLRTFFKNNWPAIKKRSKLAQELFDVFHEELTTIMPKYVEAYVQQTDAELTVQALSKRTTAWVESWSGELSQLMKLETEDKIEKVLTAGLEKGSSVDEIARAISDSGIRDVGYRARRVALTETLRAHGYAQMESYIQSPAVEGKTWRHTGGYRNKPRNNHVAMDGVTVPKKEPFTLTGADGSTYYPMVPRDTSLPASESVNCHCITQPSVSEDILGMTLEERQALQAQAVKEDDGEWMKELEARNKAKAGIEEESA